MLFFTYVPTLIFKRGSEKILMISMQAQNFKFVKKANITWNFGLSHFAEKKTTTKTWVLSVLSILIWPLKKKKIITIFFLFFFFTLYCGYLLWNVITFRTEDRNILAVASCQKQKFPALSYFLTLKLLMSEVSLSGVTTFLQLWETASEQEKDFNQRPVLLEPSGPTGFHPTCSLSIQSACPVLTTGYLWEVLAKALLIRKKITCEDLMYRASHFAAVSWAGQEQFPLAKSVLFLLIVVLFIYLAVAFVRTCSTIFSRKWG